MELIFRIKDKSGREIHLSKERWKHIKKHPHMDENKLEDIKNAIRNPLTVRYNDEVKYFYREHKEMSSFEKYILVSVKYLNGTGFVITSFFTNKITGSKWRMK